MLEISQPSVSVSPATAAGARRLAPASVGGKKLLWVHVQRAVNELLGDGAVDFREAQFQLVRAGLVAGGVDADMVDKYKADLLRHLARLGRGDEAIRPIELPVSSKRARASAAPEPSLGLGSHAEDSLQMEPALEEQLLAMDVLCEESSHFCLHGKTDKGRYGRQIVRSNCAVCRNCGHDKVAYKCAVCRGCAHGKVRQACADCSGCAHGKLKSACALCSACLHSLRRSRCGECREAALCAHGKGTRKCDECHPLCAHGTRRYWCATCRRCAHGLTPAACKDCSACGHGTYKAACAVCSGCEHNKAPPSPPLLPLV